MPRLPVLIRQNKVFELVVAGRSYAEICKQLNISEDTVARDMAAIGEQVLTLARERTGEVIAMAMATYQSVIDAAWREYHAAARRERDWYASRLDYEYESVATKTLATGVEVTPDEEVGAVIAESESAPLEVKRTVRRVRPALHNNDRRAWLTLIVDTTREYTELMGIKKLAVELSGPGGGAVPLQLFGDALNRAYGADDEPGASPGA
jgi:hypothetical protein